MKARVSPATIALYGSLLILALAYLMPVYLTLITSLKFPGDISLPQSWQLPPEVNYGSFSEAFALLKPNIVNSFILTISATLLSTTLGSLNGYVFSKWKFPGSEIIFTLFLFEVMTGRPLHPVPYVLTGAALAVFYLVLLALSEYLSFHAAYAVAAVGLVLIVTPYTSAVLGGRRRGILVGAMLSFTYGLLFVLVSAQHLSLLFGSITLLMAIAGLMYLTREVDWYDYDADIATLPKGG